MSLAMDVRRVPYSVRVSRYIGSVCRGLCGHPHLATRRKKQ